MRWSSNGLPSRDELTVYGLGATWTDQQWLAQVFMYAVYSLGGFALLSIATCVSVVGAFSIAAAAARSLGAGARAFWVMFLPVLVAAPWGWSIRAQMLALPLYTSLLWLLATQARHPSRRVWLAFPLLVVWANVHGSVALGALLVMLLGGYELVRSRGGTWMRSLALVVLAPLAVLATPYGPAATVRYYHLLLVDPPFAGRVTEWEWAAPATNTMFFYVLAAIAVVLVWVGRRRLTVFDVAVLGVTFVGGVTAIRGIVWFALACMIFIPAAIGRRLESKRTGEPRRGLNLAIATGLVVALLAVAGSLFARSESWFESYWPRRGGGGRARRAQPGGSRVRLRSLLRLDALQDPGAPRPHGVRRPLRALRRATSSTGFRTTATKPGPTGRHSRTDTASSSSTRSASRTPRSSSPSQDHVRSTATTTSR